MKSAYIHGNIYEHKEDAILVEDGYIKQVNKTDIISSILDKNDEVIDLNNMYIYPGLINSHINLLELGFNLDNFDLFKYDSVKDVLNFIKTTKNKKDIFIGTRLNDINLTKNDLDSLSIDKPIVIINNNFNKLILNSNAIKLLNFNDIELENIDFNIEEGIFESEAAKYIKYKLLDPSESDIERYILLACSYLNSLGITTVCSDDFTSLTKDYKKVLNVFEKLSYQDALNVRIIEQCSFNDIRDFSKFLDDGYTFDVGNDLFRIGHLFLNYVDEENIDLFIKLANHFNMPSIIMLNDSININKIMKILEDNILEDNPLHHGIGNCHLLNDKQIEKCINKKLICYFNKENLKNFDKLNNKTLTCVYDNSHNLLNNINIELFNSYTKDISNSLFMEDRIGSIQENHYADLVILDKDIFEDNVNPKVIMTIKQGKVVYER